MEPRVETFAHVEGLAARATEIFKGQISHASSERGRVAVALSRPTPTEVFVRIAAVRLPPGTTLLQVDERQAKRDTDDRNLTLVERDLASWVGSAHVHAMPVDEASLKRGARRYSELLEEVSGNPPVIDLIHLGLGPDGHTASLIPDDDVLEVDDQWVAVTERHKGFRRMTLTYPAINAAKLVVLIVAGAAKADALARVVRGDRKMPAARIEAPNVVILADDEAAARL